MAVTDKKFSVCSRRAVCCLQIEFVALKVFVGFGEISKRKRERSPVVGWWKFQFPIKILCDFHYEDVTVNALFDEFARPLRSRVFGMEKKNGRLF